VEHPDVAAGMAALAAGRHEAALTHLLDAVRSVEPRLREDVRDTMLGIFRELGEHHPLSTRFRRRLARAIY
jgi:putative thioredoxin